MIHLSDLLGIFNSIRRVRPDGIGLLRWLAFVLLVSGSPAQAQYVQRSFLNLGMEDPVLAPDGCFVQLNADQVLGWETTHPFHNAAGTCSTPSPLSGRLIELWRGPFSGVVARSGMQFAELNAEDNSRIYQNVCLGPGDRVNWKLSHRGRFGTDVMQFRIGPSGNIVVQANTSETGAGTHSCSSNGNITQNTCTSALGPNGWRDYSGSFVWSGPTSLQEIGFEAISGAIAIGSGNFLDDIHVTLMPHVEFSSTSGSGLESSSTNIPGIVVSGQIETATAVTIRITGGTAQLGSDYTTPSGTATFNVILPVGNYAGHLVPLGISIIDDREIEQNETITFEIVPTANYAISSTRNPCGGTAYNPSSYTILDNDTDLSITKTNNTQQVVSGASTTYRVRATNSAAVASVIGAILSDPAAPGLTKTNVVCSPVAGNRCVTAPSIAQLEAASGFALPSLGPGQFYEIDITADVFAFPAVTTVANTAWVGPPPGWQNNGASCTAGTLSPGVTRTFTPSTGRCSVTDQDIAARTTITLAKETRTAFIDQNFSVASTNFLETAAATINAGGGLTAARTLLNTMNETVLVEAATAGWRGVGVSCTDDVTALRVFNSAVASALAAVYQVAIPENTFTPGRAYTCTLTNEATRISYGKVTHPANSNQNFIIGGVNGLPQTTINATTGFSPYRVLHNPGIDTVFTELAQAEWQPLRLECVANSGNNGVVPMTTVYPVMPTPPGTAGQAYSWTVPAGTFVIGNDYTCTFVNARTRVRIAKVTEGGTGRFTFNGSPANANGFPANDSYTVVTTAPDTPAFGPFAALSRADTLTEIVETVPLGWTLLEARCEDLNAAETGNLPLPVIGYVGDGKTLVIPAENVKRGADLVCTFTDRSTGFTVSGQVILDNGASGGTAHDGIQNGGETGLGGVYLRLTNCGAVTYGRALSDGAGNFSLSLAGVPAGSQVCLVRDAVAGHIGVSGQPGTTGGTISTPAYNMLRFTAAAGTNYTGVLFGLIATPRLGIDNTATMTPDDSVLLPHRYTATTVAEVTFSGTATAEPSLSLFTVQLYHDRDCSGAVDGTDGLVTGNIPVTPGLVVCLLVRVQSSITTPPGARLRYELSALTNLSGTQATLAPATNTDVVVVTDGAVRVLKRVRNVTQGGDFSTTSSSAPGDILEYQVIFLNPSASPITGVRVLDMTPEFTSLSEAIRVEQQPAGLACQPDLPAGGGTAGYKGDLRWLCTGNMLPGDEGEVRFQVKVDE